MIALGTVKNQCDTQTLFLNIFRSASGQCWSKVSCISSKDIQDIQEPSSIRYRFSSRGMYCTHVHYVLYKSMSTYKFEYGTYYFDVSNSPKILTCDKYVAVSINSFCPILPELTLTNATSSVFDHVRPVAL